MGKNQAQSSHKTEYAGKIWWQKIFTETTCKERRI